MNALSKLLNSTGPERTAWLERQLEPVKNALSAAAYYVPPELRQTGGQVANALAMMSPGADFVDAAQSSGDMMDAARRGDGWGMAGAGAGIAAAGMGMFVPGTAKGYGSAAEEVAGMLKAGKGADITDEMIAKADPAELFDLYAAGKTGMDMPMDEASRMARAQGMYADAAKDAKKDFKVMGLRTVEEPEALLARSSVWDDGAPTDVQLKGTSATDMRKFADASAMHRINDPSAPQGDHGYYFGDYLGLIGANASSKGQDFAERVMRDPELILARNRATARFDPRLKHLANLSAGGAGVIGYNALTAERDHNDRGGM